jgi:hypothetical protein
MEATMLGARILMSLKKHDYRRKERTRLEELLRDREERKRSIMLLIELELLRAEVA